MKKVIIETFDGLGDVIMSLAVAKWYNDLGYKVDYVVKTSIVELFDFVPYVNEVYNSSHLVQWNKYDIKFSLTGKLSQYHLEICKRHRTDASFILCDVNPNKVPDECKKPILKIDDSYKQWAKQYIKSNKTNLLFSPIANAKYRTYYYFNDLLAMIDSNPKFNVIFTHDRRIPFNMNGYNLTGKTTLRQFVSLVTMVDVVLSVDTGTVQIAGTFDIPTVVIFTTIPPEWRVAYFNNVYTITPTVPCFPCMDLYLISEEKRRYCVESIVPDCVKSLTPSKIYKDFLNFVNQFTVFN